MWAIRLGSNPINRAQVASAADGIVCKHNLAQTPRSSSERTVAFHCYNAIRNHEMDRNGCTEIQDALLSLSCVGGVQALRVDPKCWQRLRKKPRLPSQQE